MNIDYKLISARPTAAAHDATFTNTVMTRIGDASKRHGIFLRFTTLRTRPMLTAFLILLGACLLSGAAYAVAYLWPRTTTTLQGVSKQDSHTVVQVFADNCGTSTTKKYGLKDGATITLDEAPKVIAANCNLEAIQTWAQQAFPDIAGANAAISAHIPNQPGHIATDVLMPSTAMPYTLQHITSSDATFADPSTGETISFPLEASTKYVLNHQYSTRDKLTEGAGVAVLVRTLQTMQADPDCTSSSCHYSITSSRSTVAAIISLDQPVKYYVGNLANQLFEIPVCEGNPQDECPSTASIDLYTPTASEDASVPHGTSSSFDDSLAYAEIAGRVVSWDAQHIVLTTTSGRQVTVTTPIDIIGTFNTTRAAGYGMTVAPGSSLTVRYYHKQGVTSDETVDHIMSVVLMMESLQKGGPYQGY